MMRRLTLLLVSSLLLTRPVMAQGTTPPGPTQPGISSNCNKWQIVGAGNTCATIEAQYGITHAQFLSWNPAVSSDCLTNFWPDYAYCVGVGAAAPTSTTASSTSSTTRVTSPPGPTFTGTPANCNSWYLVKSGDDCTAIAARYGITLAQFLAYNPAVSSNCATNFWPDYAYCVGLGPAVTSSTTGTTGTTRTTSTTTTSSPVSSSVSFNSTYSIRHPMPTWTITTPTVDTTWPPTRTQAGQVAFCNDWHLVVENENCGSIWQKYKTWMSMDDL